MINKIIDGISQKLFQEFGGKYKIYTEEVKQGLKAPCFFIDVLEPSEELFRGNRYRQINPFCIQFIPDTKEKKEKCSTIINELYRVLEYISIDETVEEENPIISLVRGSKMQGIYNDGRLNFYVNYDMFVIKSNDDTEKMEHYDYENKTEDFK